MHFALCFGQRFWAHEIAAFGDHGSENSLYAILQYRLAHVTMHASVFGSLLQFVASGGQSSGPVPRAESSGAADAATAAARHPKRATEAKKRISAGRRVGASV